MTLPGKPDTEPTAPATTAPAPGWYRVSDDGEEKGAIYLESQSDGTVYEWERCVPAWRLVGKQARDPDETGGERPVQPDVG